MSQNLRSGPGARVFLLIAALLHSHSFAVLAAPPVSGKLTTTADLPVLVNGNSARGGATIMPGSLLETPVNASALVQLGAAGDVELPPDSRAVLNFTANSVKVTLRHGCAVLNVNQGATGSIVNEKGEFLHTNSNAFEGVTGQPDFRRIPGALAKSDGGKFRRLPVCDLTGDPAPVAPASGGLGGTFLAALLALVGGPAVVGGLIVGGGNPSPS